MGLFEKLFHKPMQTTVENYFRTLSAYTPTFTTYEGGIYEMELTRAAISTFARHVSKLKPEFVGEKYSALASKLAYRPNPWMDTSKFLMRLATIFQAQNNAFIVPIEDQWGGLQGFYPVLPSSATIIEHNGEPYLKYAFLGGKTAVIEYNRTGLISQHQYKDDFFGESNRALQPTMQLIHTQAQGIREGIQNAANLRFLARIGQNLNPKDLAKEQKRFAELNLSNDNHTGVAIFDAKYADIKQVESTANIVNPKQQELIRESVYSYFGTNDAILQNKYTEDQWNAFYEGCVEPFAIQLSLVLTAMIFTEQEIADGCAVIFTTNRMQYASNTTKLNIVTQLFDRGFLTHNQGREIFNMSRVEGGDSYFIRKEYTQVSKLDSEEGERDEI